MPPWGNRRSLSGRRRSRECAGWATSDANGDFRIPDVLPGHVTLSAQHADFAEATEAIAAWWRERWLLRRIESEEVLDAVEQHTLIWPIRHGARVQLPQEETDQPSFFVDI